MIGIKFVFFLLFLTTLATKIKIKKDDESIHKQILGCWEVEIKEGNNENKKSERTEVNFNDDGSYSKDYATAISSQNTASSQMQHEFGNFKIEKGSITFETFDGRYSKSYSFIDSELVLGGINYSKCKN
jgi:hypothetical protein